MLTVTIDKRNNKVVIVFKDTVGVADAERLYTEIRRMLPDLKKGFSVVTDLSSLKHMHITSRDFLEKTMDLLNENGVSKVIRIIPDPSKDVGFNIMSLFHYSSEVAIRTCASYQEAEKYLDGGRINPD